MNVMTQMATRKQKGFTLIELVMVIVILGILAAFALPRFADLGGEARVATVQGALGAVKSASAIAHSKCLANSACDASASGQTVDLEGASIPMEFGYPAASATGIQAAAQISDDDFTLTLAGSTPEEAVFQSNSISGTCQVSYTEAADASTPPVIASTISGC